MDIKICDWKDSPEFNNTGEVYNNLLVDSQLVNLL